MGNSNGPQLRTPAAAAGVLAAVATAGDMITLSPRPFLARSVTGTDGGGVGAGDDTDLRRAGGDFCGLLLLAREPPASFFSAATLNRFFRDG